MALKTHSSTILRFGTFEADIRAGELRKQGVRIKLQDQPFQVLAVLLQRPGEVVTREELVIMWISRARPSGVLPSVVFEDCP